MSAQKRHNAGLSEEGIDVEIH